MIEERVEPFLAPNEKLGDTKCFILFSFYTLQPGMVSINPFLLIFNAVQLLSKKRCLTSMPFLLTYIDVMTVQCFLLAE